MGGSSPISSTDCCYRVRVSCAREHPKDWWDAGRRVAEYSSTQLREARGCLEASSGGRDPQCVARFDLVSLERQRDPSGSLRHRPRQGDEDPVRALDGQAAQSPGLIGWRAHDIGTECRETRRCRIGIVHLPHDSYVDPRSGRRGTMRSIGPTTGVVSADAEELDLGAGRLEDRPHPVVGPAGHDRSHW